MLGLHLSESASRKQEGVEHHAWGSSYHQNGSIDKNKKPRLEACMHLFSVRQLAGTKLEAMRWCSAAVKLRRTVLPV